MKHDIAELDLSVRAYNCLKQAGIHYVEDVSEMSDADLLAVRHLGIRCLHEVREKVAACEHGMSERDQLKAENAKLRELTAKYSAAAKYLCGHSHCNECNLDCASVFGDVPSGWDCARSLLDKEARELGVEVS